MNRLYSSLIINATKFPNVHQVFKPRFNKEFFKRLTANVDLLQRCIDKRVRDFDCDYDLKNLKEDSRKLVKLKESLEKVNIHDGDEVNPQFIKIKSQLEELEDMIMPLAVKIPNRFSKQVPEDEEVILDEIKCDFLKKQNLTKILSHRKLSFINNCYSKSVVGPNSHYYFGIGAKLQYCLADYFTNELESNKFIHASGLCLTKSAIIESNNSSEYKTFTHDSCRILTDETKLTTLHLNESSRECLTAFLTTLGPRSTNEPLRLMTAGSRYENGSEWFDSDDKSVSQLQTIHTISLAPSIENYSMKEYYLNRDLVWNMYKKLELPVRLVQCSLDTMYSNEYDASRIDIWLPSRQQWLQVARVSHYLDYITVRMGMKRGHLIDSSVYDGRVLVAAIIENRQTNNGKFKIPQVLENNLICLTEQEKSDYLSSKEEYSNKVVNNIEAKTNSNKINEFPLYCNNPKVLNNYDQKRYLVKKSYAFGHSKKAGRNAPKINGKLSVIMVLVLACFLDWTDIWREYFPTWLQRFTWDQIYRKSKLLLYYISLPNGVKPPVVPKYNELDRSYFKKTRYQIHEENMSAQDKTFAERRNKIEEIKALRRSNE